MGKKGGQGAKKFSAIQNCLNPFFFSPRFVEQYTPLFLMFQTLNLNSPGRGPCCSCLSCASPRTEGSPAGRSSRGSPAAVLSRRSPRKGQNYSLYSIGLFTKWSDKKGLTLTGRSPTGQSVMKSSAVVLPLPGQGQFDKRTDKSLTD